ncbi:hypothetical protein HDU79_010324 [Rhizoclosmatium sp. JEL0117]|nr:hypothetical protein HDU79_010324 [Rhizoclosmatium sp. JEL0117]
MEQTVEAIQSRLQGSYDATIAFLSEHDLKKEFWQILGSTAQAGVSKAATALSPVAEALVPAKEYINLVVEDTSLYLIEEVVPAALDHWDDLVDKASLYTTPVWEAYAPVHNTLSQRIFGTPITYYMVVALLFHLLTTLYPKLSPSRHLCHAKHILAATEEDAKKVQAELRKAKTLDKFSELARKSSICTSSKGRGGDLKPFKEGDGTWPKEFEEYCFGEKTREWVVSRIIKTELGYHLIMVTKKAA